MKKMNIKKLTASLMAVATLAVSMTGMSASAYGGSKTFYINNKAATASIDRYSTVGYGSTICNESDVTYLSVSVSGKDSSGTSLYNSHFRYTKGTASTSVEAANSLTSLSTHHTGTINNNSGSTDMTA